MRKGIAKENNDLIASTTLKACNDKMIMIIVGELLSMSVFCLIEAAYDNLTSRRMMMKMLLKMIILMITSAIQRIKHPAQDNLASWAAAPRSR